MSQTVYNNAPDVAFAGMRDSMQGARVEAAFNEEVTAMPFGIFVKKGTLDNQVKLFTAGAACAGFLVHSHAWDMRGLTGTQGVPASGGPCNLLKQGRAWALIEDPFVKGGDVYARHTANGGDTQAGSVRPDNDGVQQVTTVTPTATNTVLYSLDVFAGGRLFHAEYTSDGTATATEICDGLRAVYVADAAFTALISLPVAGAATLVFTGVAKGAAFQIYNGGSVGAFTSIVTGTPASVRADLVPACKFANSGAADVLGLIEINLP